MTGHASTSSTRSGSTMGAARCTASGGASTFSTKAVAGTSTATKTADVGFFSAAQVSAANASVAGASATNSNDGDSPALTATSSTNADDETSLSTATAKTQAADDADGSSAIADGSDELSAMRLEIISTCADMTRSVTGASAAPILSAVATSAGTESSATKLPPGESAAKESLVVGGRVFSLNDGALSSPTGLTAETSAVGSLTAAGTSASAETGACDEGIFSAETVLIGGFSATGSSGGGTTTGTNSGCKVSQCTEKLFSTSAVIASTAVTRVASSNSRKKRVSSDSLGSSGARASPSSSPVTGGFAALNVNSGKRRRRLGPGASSGGNSGSRSRSAVERKRRAISPNCSGCSISTNR